VVANFFFLTTRLVELPSSRVPKGTAYDRRALSSREPLSGDFSSRRSLYESVRVTDTNVRSDHEGHSLWWTSRFNSPDVLVFPKIFPQGDQCDDKKS